MHWVWRMRAEHLWVDRVPAGAAGGICKHCGRVLQFSQVRQVGRAKVCRWPASATGILCICILDPRVLLCRSEIMCVSGT